MKYYCERCKAFHGENEFCPKYKKQLKEHPEWLKEATDLTIAAGSTALIQTQALDKIAQTVNNVAGTHLTYEGTTQAVRDIQVFAKLNSDSFSKCGIFNNAETAQNVYNTASEGWKRYLRGRLNGTGQEVDWLRYRQNCLDSIINKASLPDGNTVGYDGIVQNRFTGNIVERVTVKAAEGSSGMQTNAKDIIEAIAKGNLEPDEVAFAVKGTAEEFNKQITVQIDKAIQNGNNDLANRLQSAKNNIRFQEHGTTNDIVESTKRLTKKIETGNASPVITGEMVLQKTAQGAVIAAAVSLTVSGVTNFIKYKNGEITADEAFRDVGEDTAKGALVGAAMGGVSLFLGTVGGPIAFVAGQAIAVYINATAGNLLDEVFGKGFYEQVLNAEGYICGTAQNIGELLKDFSANSKRIDVSNRKSKEKLKNISEIQTSIKQKREINKNLLEDL